MSEVALPVLIATGAIAFLATALLPTLFRKPTPRDPAVTPAAPLAFHQQMMPGREYMIVSSFRDFNCAERQVDERWALKDQNSCPTTTA